MERCPCETCLVKICCEIKEKVSKHKVFIRCGCEKLEIYYLEQRLERFKHVSYVTGFLSDRLKELKGKSCLNSEKK